MECCGGTGAHRMDRRPRKRNGAPVGAPSKAAPRRASGPGAAAPAQITTVQRPRLSQIAYSSHTPPSHM